MEFNCGLFKVKHPQREEPFMVSMMRGFGGLRCAKGFEIGEKPPRRGKHLLLTASVQNWIEELILIERIE